VFARWAVRRYLASDFYGAAPTSPDLIE
jgi:hypothetical protein